MINNLIQGMLNCPQLEITVKHYFAEKVYAREMTVPQGALVAGKVHKFENFNILSKGSVWVKTGDEPALLLKAPCSFVAPAGAQRVFLACEEFVWTVVHGTELTAISEIEDYFITQPSLLGPAEPLLIGE